MLMRLDLAGLGDLSDLDDLDDLGGFLGGSSCHEEGDEWRRRIASADSAP